MKATKLAYDNSPKTIHVIIFVMNVRIILGRPACMDGTILRKLRQLRENGEINYRCIDSEKGIYEKL